MVLRSVHWDVNTVKYTTKNLNSAHPQKEYPDGKQQTIDFFFLQIR